MALTPDIAVAVAQPLHARISHGGSGGELRGTVLAVGWDHNSDQDPASPDQMVVLMLDAATHELVWVRQADVVDMVPAAIPLSVPS